MQSNKKQEQMKEEINMHLKKKDYYQILGLPKTSDEADIKKAYKKLALRFHPDKNSVEGSKEVFKKVSNAYSTLINPEKRADYDRFGPEEDRQPQFRRRHNPYRNPDEEFQQIFRAFFGGVHQPRNQYTYTFNMGGRQHRQQNQAQANQQGFNFFHVFIFLSIIYVIPLFFKQKPVYAMARDSEYRVKVESEIFGVPFYVRQQTVQQLKTSDSYWKKVNEKVETQFLINIYKNCEQAERRRRSLEMQAYRYGPGQERERLLRKARQEDMSSCRQFNQIREEYGEYVRRLLNYY